MAVNDDVRKFILEIEESKNNQETLANLTKLEKETAKMRHENEELVKVMAHLDAQGKKNSDTYKKMDAQLKSNKKAIRENGVSIKGLTKTLDLNFMSMGQLQKRSRNLKSELKSLSAAAPRKEFDRLEAEINQTGVAMDKLRGKSKQTQGVLGKLKGAAGGLLPAFGFAAILAGMKRVFTNWAKFTDVMADAQKTTGLTRREIIALNKELQGIDTRSTQEELLELVRIGGKLGVEGKKNLLGFASAADKIGVSLKEDLGGDVEETMRKLGKLVSIFDLEKVFGIEEALLKVGSTINQLGATSTANEGFLVDFAERMAGFVPNAKLAVTDIFGIGSALDQLGQRVEASSTVVGKLLVEIGSDIPKFAAIAGKSIEEFSELLEKDANEAMIQVLEGAKSSKAGLEGMVDTLKTVGVDGSRAATVLGVLSANTELLRKEQAKANAEFEDGNSIFAEFATKNTTAQAGLEKLGKWFKNVYLNTLNSINEKLKSNTELFTEQLKEVQNLQQGLVPLIDEYETLESKSELSADEQARMKVLIEGIAEATPGAITQIDEYGNVISISTTKAREFIEVQKAMLEFQNAEAIAEQEQELEKIAFRYEKINGILKEGSKIAFIANEAIAIDLSPEQIAEYNIELQKLGKERKNIDTLLKGLTGDIFDIPTGGEKPIIPKKKKKKIIPDDFKKIKAALTTAFNQEQNLLKQQRLEKQLTQAEFNTEQYALELAHLVSMRELYKTHGEGVVTLEGQIVDKKLAWQLQLDEMLETSALITQTILQEEKEMFADIESEMDSHLEITEKQLNKESDLIIKSEGKKQKAKEAEQEANEAAREAAIESAVQTGMAAVDSAETIGEAGKAVLNSIRETIKAYIAQAVAAQALKVLETVPPPFSLILAAAAGGAATVLFNKLIPKFGSKRDGGFGRSGSDNEVDGVYHKNEFIANAQAVRNPSVKNILDIIDIAQRNGTVSSLNLNSPVPAGPASGAGGADEELKMLIATNIAINEKMLTDGVHANIPLYNEAGTGLKQELDKAQTFEENLDNA